MKHFDSFGAFALHLATRTTEVRHEVERGLESAAERIEATARSEFGVYQPAQGPFPAWDPLGDATQAERAMLGFTPNDPLLRAGDLQAAVTHEVDRGDLSAVVGVPDGKLGDVMVAQELGTSRIPPRPVLGPAAYRNKEAIRKLVGAAVVAGIVGADQIHASLGYDFEASEVGES